MSASSATLALAATTFLALGGCTISDAAGDSFPALSADGEISVFAGSSSTHEPICRSADPALTRAFVTSLKERYPSGWKKASSVTYATMYTITFGSGEILVLKRGIIVQQHQGSRYILMGHQGNVDDAEHVVRLACGGPPPARQQR